MIKFYNIGTDDFVPISHDKYYLFNFYDRLSNFLAINISSDHKLKYFLAKPVKNNYEIDFYSIYSDLVFLDELQPDIKNKVLFKYWDIITIINKKIESLERSKDDNNKDWAKLLKLVFNDKNNLVYSNGDDICIIWGWKFENNSNYKPQVNTSVETEPSLPIPEPDITQYTEISKTEASDQVDIPPKPEDNNPDDEHILPDPKEVLTEEPIEEPIDDSKKSSFLEFLKWFASKYWWFLIVLLVLITIVFFVKSL